jgi:hypothetical protein
MVRNDGESGRHGGQKPMGAQIGLFVLNVIFVDEQPVDDPRPAFCVRSNYVLGSCILATLDPGSVMPLNDANTAVSKSSGDTV